MSFVMQNLLRRFITYTCELIPDKIEGAFQKINFFLDFFLLVKNKISLTLRFLQKSNDLGKCAAKVF